MEQFCRESRYPNLIKFCNEQSEAVKLFIKHFDTQSDAKINLRHKFKSAFYNAKGKNKRGSGVEVNLDTLFAEAKAESAILAEGWNTLGVSVINTSHQMRDRLKVIKVFFWNINSPTIFDHPQAFKC